MLLCKGDWNSEISATFSIFTPYARFSGCLIRSEDNGASFWLKISDERNELFTLALTNTLKQKWFKGFFFDTVHFQLIPKLTINILSLLYLGLSFKMERSPSDHIAPYPCFKRQRNRSVRKVKCLVQHQQLVNSWRVWKPGLLAPHSCFFHHTLLQTKSVRVPVW